MTGAPTTELRFRWRWRPHQQRVLDTVDRHLEDHRLHLVAAPGAGKTSLGLEVFRRLGRPAVVLAPTLTIRDQWLHRLEDFVPPAERGRGATESWTSADLRRPAFFTATTYQALLAISRQDEVATGLDEDEASEEPEVPAAPTKTQLGEVARVMREADVGVLILDEAHHLKRAWWSALERLVESLDGVQLVSLTGTPPYDATGTEWRRYEELCGPIDDEISVPELVRAGTLCPHQDLIYAVQPSAAAQDRVREHEAAVRDLEDGVVHDPRFQGEVDRHPWLASAEPDVEAVLDRPALAIALLSYQRAAAGLVPSPLLEILDLAPYEVPVLDRALLEVLIGEYLFGDSFAAADEVREEMRARLRAQGLVHRRTVRLDRPPVGERLLGLSAAKIEACAAIHRAEVAVRGDTLRQVILTDYIRSESLEVEPGAAGADLGAFPVFDAIAHGSTDAPRVALVTGRLAVVHRQRWPELSAALDEPAASAEPLPHRPDWLRVSGASSSQLVRAFTGLLTDGALHLLVGTRQLLGEGWDAPVVNSLVLASSVGATVSTNQMRGRAIRRDPAAPRKVASVWHIVAVVPEVPAGLMDLRALEERFRTFVGLSADGRVIESGLERLALPPMDAGWVARLNEHSVGELASLEAIAYSWREAVDGEGPRQVVPTVSHRAPRSHRPVVFENAGRLVLAEAAILAAWAALELGFSALTGAGSFVVALTAILALVALGPATFRAVRFAFLHAPVYGSVRQIGQAVLAALRETGLVEGEDVALRTEVDRTGSVHLWLDGGSFYAQGLFSDALGEVLGPIDNPRYILVRTVRGPLGPRGESHAVPHVLGRRKEMAQAFLEAWRREVGLAELIFTRREGGRTALLRARARAFSAQAPDAVERLDRWR